jgi:aspartyl-tRNA(Asn)/glutamyl-tRNA(Gln) amidotransferase subunit A
MIEDLAGRSAAAIGRMIAAGTLDPVDTAEFFLDRIRVHQNNPAFITVTTERARREAEASRRRHREGRPVGPLDGVPVAWKDVVDMARTRTTAGSILFRESPPKDWDAPIVASLSAAGAVSLGKTNLPEFSLSAVGLNPHFGNPFNPRDLATLRISGGSSSGCAVAVAAGLAPCAIGTDNGGSIRVPATYTGIIGFKPTERRIDSRGVFPASRTLDSTGPMARTVEDCVLIDMALRGAVSSEVRRLPTTALDLVVPDKSVIDDADDAVAANMERALSKLSAAGAKIERRSMPLIGEMRALAGRHGSLVVIEIYTEYRNILESPDADRMDQRVVARARLGKATTGYDLLSLQRGRDRLMRALAAELGDALLVVPGTPMIAPPIAPIEADDELFRATNLRSIHYTFFIGNLFGMCGLAIPTGTDGGGLPTGVQFLARGGTDDHLLSAGLAIDLVLAAEKLD